jgi:hypothetical protein
MMTRRKLSGLDCSKSFYLRASLMGFIVTEESKLKYAAKVMQKPSFKISGERMCASRAFTSG